MAKVQAPVKRPLHIDPQPSTPYPYKKIREKEGVVPGLPACAEHTPVEKARPKPDGSSPLGPARPFSSAAEMVLMLERQKWFADCCRPRRPSRSFQLPRNAFLRRLYFRWLDIALIPTRTLYILKRIYLGSWFCGTKKDENNQAVEHV